MPGSHYGNKKRVATKMEGTIPHNMSAKQYKAASMMADLAGEGIPTKEDIAKQVADQMLNEGQDEGMVSDDQLI